MGVCKICSAETRHARNNIYTHLRECHSMTVDHYGAEYGVPGQAQKPTRAPYSGAEENSGQEYWNKCRFKCPLCEQESNEKKRIRQHTIREHGVSLEVLEQEHGECEIFTEFFVCGLCNREMKH